MAEFTQHELLSLDARMENERMMVKKFKEYARLCTDPQLRLQCEQVAARHQEHLRQLLNQLQ